MNTFRYVYQTMPAIIQVPDSLQNRKVEVILQPLDNHPQPQLSIHSYDWIGKWQGEPLTRPDQGQYEFREPLA